MELQTVIQVSRAFGISAQMLRYYERSGLINSRRKDGYSYRVYDEENIRRLQQIIILRKLQIPVRQIRDILDNRDAVAVIEVFKQNISELDEQITALSTVRSILARFVEELRQKADIQLKLDLLNDTAMLSVVGALSFSENKIGERISMEELNRASETLGKQAEKNVRIVYRPPATMAQIRYSNDNVPYEERKNVLMAMAKKFVEDNNLFAIKPDMRVFGYGMLRGKDLGTLWITIPDDLEVMAPITKRKYPGGLYAAAENFDGWIGQWVEDSEDYEWYDSNGQRAIGDDYFNPFNIYGLDYGDYETTGCLYNTEMFPIREVKKLSDEEKKKINLELDKLIPRGEPIEIDLPSMILDKKDGGICELNYPNGFIELKYHGGHNAGIFWSPQQFNAPIKMELRAKTDKANLFFGCAQIFVVLNERGLNGLNITDTTNGSYQDNFYKKCGVVPADEFVDIEVFFSREGVAIRVDGELRHYSSDYGYIKALRENKEYTLGAVFVGTGRGSTVTVESLRVTEF